MGFQKKNQGFSLLEVMVALAVVSFLSFTVLQLVFTNLKATKAVEITASLDNLLMEVNMALKDPAVCQSNLSNFVTTTLPTPVESGSINLTQITLPSATVPLARTNAPIPSQPSTRLSLSIGNIKPISTASYLANISFSLDKGQGTIGARNIVRHLPLTLTSSTAGAPITGCYTFGPSTGGPSPTGSPPPPASTLAQMCALFGRTFDADTGKCSGGPLPTLDVVCESMGGTFESSTGKCTVATVVTGGTKPVTTPTPRTNCGPSAATCGGKTWPVGELVPDGRFTRDWTDTISGILTRCQLSVACQGPNWSGNNCSCVVVK